MLQAAQPKFNGQRSFVLPQDWSTFCRSVNANMCIADDEEYFELVGLIDVEIPRHLDLAEPCEKQGDVGRQIGSVLALLLLDASSHGNFSRHTRSTSARCCSTTRVGVVNSKHTAPAGTLVAWIHTHPTRSRLDYLWVLKNQGVFNSCLIPAAMAMATLELFFMNTCVFGEQCVASAAAASLRVSSRLPVTPATRRCPSSSTNRREVPFIFCEYTRIRQTQIFMALECCVWKRSLPLHISIPHPSLRAYLFCASCCGLPSRHPSSPAAASSPPCAEPLPHTYPPLPRPRPFPMLPMLPHPPSLRLACSTRCLLTALASLPSFSVVPIHCLPRPPLRPAFPAILFSPSTTPSLPPHPGVRSPTALHLLPFSAPFPSALCFPWLGPRRFSPPLLRAARTLCPVCSIIPCSPSPSSIPSLAAVAHSLPSSTCLIRIDPPLHFPPHRPAPPSIDPSSFLAPSRSSRFPFAHALAHPPRSPLPALPSLPRIPYIPSIRIPSRAAAPLSPTLSSSPPIPSYPAASLYLPMSLLRPAASPASPVRHLHPPSSTSLCLPRSLPHVRSCSLSLAALPSPPPLSFSLLPSPALPFPAPLPCRRDYSSFVLTTPSGTAVSQAIDPADARPYLSHV
ncbi:hypothetical protein DFH09DRAFT_1414910 [Mycena vulgaris]|nr:hypothetical protein DFH09DRAFT_1414910 [Mycena vulgaris]